MKFGDGVWRFNRAVKAQPLGETIPKTNMNERINDVNDFE